MAHIASAPRILEPRRHVVRTVRQPDLVLTRRGRIVLWVVAAVLLLAGMLLGGRALAGGPGEPVEVVPYTIAQGETVWALASTVALPGEDVRDVVADIIALNGRSTAELRVGEQILLPVR